MHISPRQRCDWTAVSVERISSSRVGPGHYHRLHSVTVHITLTLWWSFSSGCQGKNQAQRRKWNHQQNKSKLLEQVDWRKCSRGVASISGRERLFIQSRLGNQQENDFLCDKPVKHGNMLFPLKQFQLQNFSHDKTRARRQSTWLIHCLYQQSFAKTAEQQQWNRFKTIMQIIIIFSKISLVFIKVKKKERLISRRSTEADRNSWSLFYDSGYAACAPPRCEKISADSSGGAAIDLIYTN